MTSRILVAFACATLAGCAPNLAPLPDADGGAPDAGAPDAGTPDAGTPDAGTPDAGTPDAGAPDAGAPDAGSDAGVIISVPEPGRFAADFDAGACVLTRQPPAGLSSSPRGDGFLELLVLQGAPWLEVVDDDTFARVEREAAELRRDGGGPAGFIPTWGEGVLLTLDDAGTAELATRSYHAWDCLNWAWRGTPQLWPWTGVSSRFVFVKIDPVVRLPELAAEYAQLPHVESATADSYGICAACGCASDLCLDLGDAGAWTWLWYVDGRTCTRDWYRAMSEADGGLRVEAWVSDGGLPREWLDASPGCRSQLWATQFLSP